MSANLGNVTCVAIDGRAVLIEGAPGSGKSSLALALIDRGAVLIGDDGVTLEDRDGRLWAAPPPNIAGLIEIRNLGLVPLPSCSAPLSLVVRLDAAAPRFIERAAKAVIAGHTLPVVAMWPETPALALRLEYALKTYGLG